MQILVSVFIGSAINIVYSLSDQEICSKCPALREDSQVFQFCKKVNSSQTMFINQSCCVNKTLEYSDIIGLDWSECGLKSITGLLSSLTFLQELMLENNTELTFKSEDFDGLINLDYFPSFYISLPRDRAVSQTLHNKMSLPSGMECPGGNNSWNSTEKVDNAVICHTEINLCHNHNMTCPNNNSHCVLTAPGKLECLCNNGYYGYKCLRQGQFPTAGYSIVLCVCTVFLSGFLWCTQRRKVIKVH